MIQVVIQAVFFIKKKEGNLSFILIYKYYIYIYIYKLSNNETNTCCLTTWPHPIFYFYSTFIKTNIGISCSSILIKIPIE